MLRDNLFDFSQIKSNSNSLLSNHVRSFRSSPPSNTEVSSAYMMFNKKFEISHISFTYIMKSKGPSKDPCGTPHLIGWVSEYSLLFVCHVSAMGRVFAFRVDGLGSLFGPA